MKYDVVKREGKHPKEYYYGEKYRGMKTIEFMGKEQKDSPKQVQRMLNVTRLIGTSTGSMSHVRSITSVSMPDSENTVLMYDVRLDII